MSSNRTIYNTLDVLGYPVYISGLEEIDLSTKCLINTINQHSFVVAEKDYVFKKTLIDSDILLPDGVGIVAAAKIFCGQEIKKIAGADLHEHMLQKLNDRKGSCFYLGSSDSTLAKIKEKLEREYPDIKAGFFSPKFKPVFSEEDTSEMIDVVNTFCPDILFIGMTAPKQEKWAYENKDRLQTYLICSIGAVFDFYAGTINRPSKMWINLGMEWFIRLVREPKRMWRRYLYNGPVFIYLVFKKKLFGKSFTGH